MTLLILSSLASDTLLTTPIHAFLLTLQQPQLCDLKCTPGQSLGSYQASQHQKPKYFPLFLNNCDIATVQSHKYLGLICINDSQWTTNILMYLQKAWQRFGNCRFVIFMPYRSSFEKKNNVNCLNLTSSWIVLCCLRQLLERHGDSIEAARIVRGATKMQRPNSSIRSRLGTFGFEPIHRFCHTNK